MTITLNSCHCTGAGRKWCWLDFLFQCKNRVICDRHDDWITK